MNMEKVLEETLNNTRTILSLIQQSTKNINGNKPQRVAEDREAMFLRLEKARASRGKARKMA